MAFQTLQEYLDALLAERDALNIKIAGVQEALGQPADDDVPAGATPGLTSVPRRAGPPGHVRSDAFFRMSIPEAIKAYLEIVKQPQTPKAIHDGLKAGGVLTESEHFPASVRTALKRLKKQGQAVNTKRGAWGLFEWYSGRSGAALADRPKKGSGKGKGKGTKGKGKAKAANKSTPTGPTLVKPKKGPTEYQRFVAEQSKAGKTLAQIGPLWKQKKAGAS